MHETSSVLLNRLLACGKFRHIQILLKLAELGSVQRTADAIGITQSSVTQTLAYLEQLLDIPLFLRHARGVTPTPACMAFIPVARHLLQGISDSAECISAYRRMGEGVVRLAASSSAINYLLTPSLPLFHAQYPTIQVQLREAEGADQLLAISRQEVDLVIGRLPRKMPDGWYFSALRPDRLIVVASAQHRLAGREVGWSELAEETWVLAPAGSLVREKMDEISRYFPWPLSAYPLVTRSISLFKTLLVQHDLVALLPLSFISHAIAAGEFCELKIPLVFDVAPMGYMLPDDNGRDAARKLADFLSRRFACLNEASVPQAVC
ncbi:LysR family transcriptional regulator [Musicola keenii]|uniref:LysR family transcriptional regulator n=1 Tax=Musicola keenii TaxID=2884250 RepID=UPI001782E044|nr:LysR family transcriptional regulator [Musicola keenii]